MVEYVGFDVSKEATAFRVMDAAGKVLARGEVARDPAPHADHRRAVPRAGKEGRRDGVKATSEETTAVPRKRKPRPRGDGGRGDPAWLVARRTTFRDGA